MARKMTAKYPGRCRECCKAIEPGDKIVHAGKKENYHAVCYEERDETTPVAAADAAAAAPTFTGDYEAADNFAWGL